MSDWFWSILRCPRTGSALVRQGDLMIGENRSYPVVQGVPHLLEEEALSDLDLEFQRQYTERDARRYDRTVRLLSLAMGVWEPAQRARMVSLLGLAPGARVLEVSVGTGANLPFLSRQIGPQGQIVALDLSVHMMAVAQERARRLMTPVHFCRGDACQLPFADGQFDALFHFGGINMFGNLRRAIAEMVRVTKPGGSIVVGDEGMSESVRRSWLGRRLSRVNSLYRCRPPFADLPWSDIEGFELHWVWRETFYVLSYRRRGVLGESAPQDVQAEIRHRLASK